MRIVAKAPWAAPAVKDIPNSVEALQAEVGGYFEAYRFGHLWLMCNEEGKLKGLEPNVEVPGLGVIVGPVVITKADDEGEHIDLTDRDAEWAMKLLRQF